LVRKPRVEFDGAFYQTFNQVATITDPLNHTTTLGYDAKGNLVTTTDPLNHTTSFVHNSIGQPASTTNALGQVTQMRMIWATSFRSPIRSAIPPTGCWIRSEHWSTRPTRRAIRPFMTTIP
jgi:YD repeat-containing protein